MSRSFEQLIALLQSANAQTQLITAMIGEVHQAEERPTMTYEEKGRIHPLGDLAPISIEEELMEHAAFFGGKESGEPTTEEQGWTFSLEPGEVERAEAIAKALDFPEGNTTITEIVQRGLASLEAELEAEIEEGKPVIDTKDLSPARWGG